MWAAMTDYTKNIPLSVVYDNLAISAGVALGQLIETPWPCITAYRSSLLTGGRGSLKLAY